MRPSLLNCVALSRRHFTTSASCSRVFQEGDLVLLRQKRDNSHEGILLKLRASKELTNHHGKLPHSDIIGKHVRQIVQTNRGQQYRIHEPTLAEYVRLSPRLVTPIYPSDANIIVSLLDIHVEPPPPTPPPNPEPPLEILEAGTGHGALTLHLARAIQAANPPLPSPPPSITSSASSDDPSASSESTIEDPVYLGETVSDLSSFNLEAWKSSRRAILHTVEAVPKVSKQARRTVSGFRNGLYAPHVEFHIDDVSAWIAAQITARKTDEPFLSHVFLDLPSADEHLQNVWPALKVDGLLAVFNPSVTQIIDCVDAIREQRLPFILDQVVELGVGCIRQWDVRSVVPRAVTRKAAARISETQEPPTASPGESEVETDQSSDSVAEVEEAAHGLAARDAEMINDLSKQGEEARRMVCRPKAFQNVVGGGFVGLWRRMEPAEGYDEQGHKKGWR